MADSTTIRRQVQEICERMSSALGRISLAELPISTLDSGAIETFKTIIIEVSVEFKLPTKMHEGHVTGLIEIYDSNDRVEVRKHMIVLFLMEVTIKRIIAQWQLIQQRAEAYGVMQKNDEKFVMPDTMRKHALNEVSLLLSEHAEQLVTANAQHHIFEKVMSHEHQ